MKEKEIIFHYKVYAGIEELDSTDAALLQTARAATANAYAPYSNFYVAATALLENGSVVSATNQENASYPVGICAERSLLSTVAAMFPHQKIITMAISYFNHGADKNNAPVSPCGMCRQALLEWEGRQESGLKIILSAQNGEVFILGKAADLLPLSFAHNFLK